MLANRCPSNPELVAFHLGDLAEEFQEDLAEHIETCNLCEVALQRIEGLTDPVLDALRKPGGQRRSLTRWLEAPPVQGTRAWPLLPGYEVIALLGRGGMGIVYKARQLSLSRIVALKMIVPGSHGGVDELLRLQSEAEAVARLQHPNLVQIYEIGRHLGQPFLSLEYVDGGSLDQRLAGSPQPPRAAAEMVEMLARAMHCAHEHHIIHRDLKPANVLLTRDGTPKISDFGLAKRLDCDIRLTQAGLLAGTPCYMAPEQANPNLGPLAPATDVYSLGVILYEMLTGRVPLDGGAPFDTLTLVCSKEPVPPRQLQPRVPRDLETICLKCLQKDARKRYPTAGGLADDLRRFLAGEPIIARPTSVGERSWKWARRQPAVAGLLAAVVLVAVLGFAGVLWQWRSALSEGARARRHEMAAVDERRLAETARDRAETNVYFSRIARARLEWRLDFNAAGAVALLDQCKPGPGETDRRGWEWHYLKGLTHADLLTLGQHDGYVYALAHSPDGRLLASAGGGNHFYSTQGPDSIRPSKIILWDAITGEVRHRLGGHQHLVTGLAFSPDGSQLATAGYDCQVRFWDVANGKLLHTLEPGLNSLHSVAFSPDGKYLALGHDRSVTLWEFATGQLRQTFSGHSHSVWTLTFSPDGKRLLAGSRRQPTEGEAKIWDVATGGEVRTLPAPTGAANAVAWSPDGSRLATTDGPARIWDAATGQLLHTFTVSGSNLQAVAFSPDGSQVATAGADRAVRLWSLDNGAEIGTWAGHAARVRSLSFHPSGRALASGDEAGVIKVWDLTQSPEGTIVNRLGYFEGEGLAFDSGGQNLRVVFRGGSLQEFDIATDRVRGEQALDFSNRWQTPATLAAFTADGRRLAGVSHLDPRLIQIWDAAAGTALGSLGGTKAPAEERLLLEPHQVAWARNGQRLASLGQGTADGQRFREIKVWDVAAKRPRMELRLPAVPVRKLYGGLALSPDGRRLAIDEYAEPLPAQPDARVTASIRIYDVDAGRPLAALAGLDSLIAAAAFSPDGRWLVAADFREQVLVWDLATGQPLYAAALAFPIYQLAFSPDGNRLAGINRDEARVWDVATGQEVLRLRGAPPRPGDNGFNPRVAWSADGRQLATSNWNGTISVWDTSDQDSAEARTARRQAWDSRAFAWHLAKVEEVLRDRADFRLAFHLSFIDKAVAPDGARARGRAYVRAALGQWHQAAADARMSLQRYPPLSIDPSFRLACLLVLAGDAEAGARLCREAPARFGPPRNPEDTLHLAVTLALLDGAAKDPEAAVALARPLAEDKPANTWRQHVLSLALLRSGHWEEAAAHCRTALQTDEAGSPHALNRLVLALAQYRLGQKEEAKLALGQVEAWVDKATHGRPGRIIYQGDMNDGLELLVLFREAQSLLGKE